MERQTINEASRLAMLLHMSRNVAEGQMVLCFVVVIVGHQNELYEW